jgi:hypothetical protein
MQVHDNRLAENSQYFDDIPMIGMKIDVHFVPGNDSHLRHIFVDSDFEYAAASGGGEVASHVRTTALDDSCPGAAVN